MQKEKIMVLGSGPAGLTAAIYVARANMNPLVMVGNMLGGQVAITNEVENYPGFPESVGGAELVEKMRAQAEHFGARFQYDEIVEARFNQGSPFWMKDTSGREYEADAVVITVGATARRLNVPGEEEFIGRGVSYCGTCDGFFFRGKEVVVIGGGDSALEEGIFLTRFATHVTVIHRRDTLRAGTALQARAFANEKISFIWDSVVEKIEGEGAVQRVHLVNRVTGEKSVKETDGVFIFVGHDPNNKIFTNQLETKDGYLIVDPYMMTSVPGVFAAGEIMDPIYRQVATSVGQGAAAGIMAERWLAERDDEKQGQQKIAAAEVEAN